MSVAELIPIDGLLTMDMAPVPHGSSRMGGSMQSIIGRVGPTRQKLRVETVNLDAFEARIWSTWLQRRIDLGESFTAWKLFRINPLLGVGASPDGAIPITIDAPNNQITLFDVPSYTASVGDTISYRTAAGGYYWGEVQATTPAVGSTCANIPILPKPLAAHGIPAVRRVQALAEFELTTPLAPFEDYTGRSIQFEAMQVLR